METRPSKDQLQPTGDWIVVEPLEVSDVTESGIMLPTDSNSSMDCYGRVLAVGDGFWQAGEKIKPSVEAGEVVMYRRGRGVEMRLKREKVLFMTERDFFARIRE